MDSFTNGFIDYHQHVLIVNDISGLNNFNDIITYADN